MFNELVQRTRDILTGVEMACHVDSSSNETRMFRMLIECRKNIQNALRVQLEYTSNAVRYFFTSNAPRMFCA